MFIPMVGAKANLIPAVTLMQILTLTIGLTVIGSLTLALSLTLKTILIQILAVTLTGTINLDPRLNNGYLSVALEPTLNLPSLSV